MGSTRALPPPGIFGPNDVAPPVLLPSITLFSQLHRYRPFENLFQTGVDSRIEEGVCDG